MEADDGAEDEGPLLPWISPDDRLWRHPSEMATNPGRVSSTPAPPAPSRPVRSTGTRLWSVAMVAGVVGAIIASGVGVATGNFEHRTTLVQSNVKMMSPTSLAMSSPSTSRPPANTGGVTPASTTLPAPGPVSSSSNPDWPLVAKGMAPSLVSITATGASGEMTGSGVLYSWADNRSYILTSSSLIGDGKIQVTFDNSETQVARVVGVDPQTGLGLVSVQGSSRVFPAFDEESDIQIAEPVLGMGSGFRSTSVTYGSISALDVAIDTGEDATMENLIAVNSGGTSDDDPGEALVDPQGAVVGIEAAVDSPDQTSAAATYVVPFDVARHVANQLLAGSHVTHPWLGTLDTKDPSSATASQLRLAGGAQITAVAPGSPAARAGISPSDIITSFNGQPVRSTGSLTDLVDNCDVGHTASITYLHAGQPTQATVTLTETPGDVNLTAVGG